MPVMWYLMKAFSLRVADVLPIQMWIHGVESDDKVNSWMLPRIAEARDKWQPASNESAAPMLSEAIPAEHDLSIVE